MRRYIDKPAVEAADSGPVPYMTPEIRGSLMRLYEQTPRGFICGYDDDPTRFYISEVLETVDGVPAVLGPKIFVEAP